jgi:hypothetical protein
MSLCVLSLTGCGTVSANANITQLTVIKSTTANRIEPLQRGKSYIIYFDQPKSEF